MFMETLLLVIAAIWVGWKWREISAIRTMEKERKKRETSRIEELADKIQQTFIETRVEKIGQIFYLHDKETGEFLAQGETPEALSSALRERFPKKRFVMDKNDLNMIGIYDE